MVEVTGLSFRLHPSTKQASAGVPIVDSATLCVFCEANLLANLKKWQKGTSDNPAGRKLGSKNIATSVRELIE